VRDLWALRVQKLQDRIEDVSTSGENTPLFSSQAEDSGGEQSQRRKLADSPRLIETLCLCYLGASLLRIPVTVGEVLSYVLFLSITPTCVMLILDIYRLNSWVAKQEIPFLRAIREIPWSMKDRLPPSYHNSLDSKVQLLSVLNKLLKYGMKLTGFRISPAARVCTGLYGICLSFIIESLAYPFLRSIYRWFYSDMLDDSHYLVRELYNQFSQDTNSIM
jgi:hypothetical protein